MRKIAQAQLTCGYLTPKHQDSSRQDVYERRHVHVLALLR